MSIFGFGKSQKSTDAGAFLFADGSRCSPQEYGYLAVSVGFNSAVEETDALFGPGAMGEQLGLGQAIRRARFPADIYACTLIVGVYLWHAASQVNVSDVVVQRVVAGIGAGFKSIKAPNGGPIESDLGAVLLSLAKKFAVLITTDGQEMAVRSPGTIYPNALPSTEYLIEIIIKGSSSDPLVHESWKTELTGATGLWLRRMIEASTQAQMQLLRDKLKVRYVE